MKTKIMARKQLTVLDVSGTTADRVKAIKLLPTFFEEMYTTASSPFNEPVILMVTNPGGLEPGLSTVYGHRVIHVMLDSLPTTIKGWLELLKKYSAKQSVRMLCLPNPLYDYDLKDGMYCYRKSLRRMRTVAERANVMVVTVLSLHDTNRVNNLTMQYEFEADNVIKFEGSGFYISKARGRTSGRDDVTLGEEECT